MAASLRLRSSFLRIKSLFQLQRMNHTFVRGELEAELVAEMCPKTKVIPGHVDTLKWKKLDSRSLGLALSMIPDSSRIVLRILQSEGHDAYLVGGCVRDLLLNRVPKDFDVITTANLQQIKKQFHRAFIIGRRFPICKVLIRGSAVEVSSFETVAKDAKKKEDIKLPKLPKGYDEKDILRWKNALKRDFTINSLFYDPFAHKVYDYSCGMDDLMSMKLRTLRPAHMSFQEDCARILRGLRIAARLHLSFAKDTDKAMRNLHASVANLDKARLMMEMNYMLSYGAAESSILLLKRFNLLELLLPFHAAYLNNKSGAQSPLMLMRLFFNLDSIFSCDQPCDPGVWVGLLAFHLALVNNPQDPLVVWTFASVLYQSNWEKGVRAARQLAEACVNFEPEILKPCNDLSDNDLARRVVNFSSLVLDALDALTDSESLVRAMDHYPSSPRAGLVFISKNAGNEVAKFFGVLVNDIESLTAERPSSINYKLLREGSIEEARFVIGKVIMDTMGDNIVQFQTDFVTEKDGLDECKPKTEQEKAVRPASEHETLKTKKMGKRGLLLAEDQQQQRPKKQKKSQKILTPLIQKFELEKMSQILSCRDISKKKQQLKKAVVKDVKRLLTLKKGVGQKGAKLELRKCHETQEPKLTEVCRNMQENVAKDKQPKPKDSSETPKEDFVASSQREKEHRKKETRSEEEHRVAANSSHRIQKLSSLFK